MKYRYEVQVRMDNGNWWAIFADNSKAAAEGYMIGRRDAAWPPTREVRLVRFDSNGFYKTLDEEPARTEVALGCMAGFPTPEQYEEAAKRAMHKAQVLREIGKQ